MSLIASEEQVRWEKSSAGGETELSVVLPCLNEARTLPACIAQIQRAIGDHHINAEIIVADNGSASSEIAASLGARVLPCRTAVTTSTNRTASKDLSENGMYLPSYAETRISGVPRGNSSIPSMRRSGRSRRIAWLWHRLRTPHQPRSRSGARAAQGDWPVF